MGEAFSYFDPSRTLHIQKRGRFNMIRLFQVAMSPAAKHEVGKVLDSGYIGEGPKVKEFEAALEKTLGMPVLAVNSGTSAIDLALHLCGVGPGDEVITTAQTCTATNTMIANRKAQIVWADVNKFTGNIDPADVSKKITARTKAIIAVDWGGRICDFEALNNFRISTIEDAAHAFGSTQEEVSDYRSVRHPSGILVPGSGPPRPAKRGNLIAWSFQAIKHLTTGDGGAIGFGNRGEETYGRYYIRAKLLRWYGLDRDSSASFRCAQTINEAGYKYHMNDIAATIGLANLQLAQENVKKHQDNAMFYNVKFREFADKVYADAVALRNAPGRHEGIISTESPITDPVFDPGSSYWLYTILVSDRDGFIERMAAKGVECSPVHARNDKHPAFRGYSGDSMDGKSPLPGLDYFAAHEVAIPVGWWLTEADREYVAKSVLECAT